MTGFILFLRMERSGQVLILFYVSGPSSRTSFNASRTVEFSRNKEPTRILEHLGVMPLKAAILDIFNYRTGLRSEVEILKTEFSHHNRFCHPSISLGQPCQLLGLRQSAGTKPHPCTLTLYRSLGYITHPPIYRTCNYGGTKPRYRVARGCVTSGLGSALAVARRIQLR